MYSAPSVTNDSGFKINAHPLARGDRKPRGMSRIFAQVVRRASGYYKLFCQLYVPMNESNYWNLTRMPIKLITTRLNNPVDLITLCKLFIIIELASVKQEQTPLTDTVTGRGHTSR